MPDIPCGKCGSMNIGKNGTAAAGERKYLCKACDFHRSGYRKACFTGDCKDIPIFLNQDSRIEI